MRDMSNKKSMRLEKVKQDNEKRYDVIVIGAGPGGLAAARAAKEWGDRRKAAQSDEAGSPADVSFREVAESSRDLAKGGREQLAGNSREREFRVALLERDEIPGGILNQCVHDGFGIVRFGRQLSGPEYGQIETEAAGEAGVEILTGCMVTELGADPRREGLLVTAVSRRGLIRLRAGAVVLATGCRERTRGMLRIPGTRPAGIYTAGTAQNLINRRNLMVGREVVILGSGDIGLIMARRLTLEGARVIGVAEVMKEPSGLARNVRQCLFDYDIPLYLQTTVSRIYGKDRLDGVELSRVDERLQPIPGSQRRIPCDTLILSVGLIPENEVGRTAGVALDTRTNGALTDAFLQTSVPGIFACGNARAVMDLADFVTEQGEAAGRNAAAHALGQPLQEWTVQRHNAARKGMPAEGSLTCTRCPKGCQITVRRDTDGKGLPIHGNGCERGADFARQEMIDPVRILTTTMRLEDGRAGSSEGSLLVPVRSDRPVPLRELRDLVKGLRQRRIQMPSEGIRRGDVLVRDLDGKGINIIAERALEAEPPKAEPPRAEPKRTE